jgi:AAA15 family ATPase/GTPase
MIHKAVSKDNEILAHIDFDNESLGTRRMYRLAGPLFHTLIYGGVLIIDELEDSLHIHMLKTLLGEFIEHSNQSQIIFTTHNVQLLEEKIFRRDEIWFTEKSEDGASELFSLADFKPKPRKDKSLKNGYLNGAFGALPLVGDLLGE